MLIKKFLVPIMVVFYSYFTLRKGIGLSRYYLPNKKYIDAGACSKFTLNTHVPSRYALKTALLAKESAQEIEKAFGFPLVLKPDCGHLGKHVYKVNDVATLKKILRKIRTHVFPYVIQAYAAQKKEFDILYVRGNMAKHDKVLAVTQADHSTDIKRFDLATYKDITNSFSRVQKQEMANILRKVFPYAFARVTLKANAAADLTTGAFKVIEANILYPAPVHILDQQYSLADKFRLIRTYIKAILALVDSHKGIKAKNLYALYFSHNNQKKSLEKTSPLHAFEETINYVRTAILLETCSDYNTLQARRASRTKRQARELFEQLHIPYAKGFTFYNPLSTLFLLRKLSYPIVIKPNLGGFSRGSWFPLTNWKQVLFAACKVKIHWPRSIIEECLTARNYRVVVGFGKVICVTERFAAYVEGDGKHTIEELIHTENDIREKMHIYPVMHPIAIDKKTVSFLKKQKLTLLSKPKKGVRVSLYHRVALAPGGVLRNLSTKLPAENNKMLFDLLEATNADIFGIDIICEDIHKPFTKQKCIFLELNSRPYLHMHKYPRWGKPVDVEAEIRAIQNGK